MNMSPDWERYESLSDRRLAGETLGADETSWLDRFEHEHPDAAIETAMLDQLAEQVEQREAAAVSERQLDAIVAAAAAAPELTLDPPPAATPRGPWSRRGVIVAALAAAAILTVWVTTRATSRLQTPAPPDSLVVVTPPASADSPIEPLAHRPAETVAAAPEAPNPSPRIVDGTFRGADGPVDPTAPLPSGVSLTSGDHGCIAMTGLVACAKARASLRLDVDRGLTLESGRFAITREDAAAPAVRVTTHYTVQAGTHSTIDVDLSHSRIVLSVTQGSVSIEDQSPGGDPRRSVISAGQTWTRERPPRPTPARLDPPAPSPASLLRQARRQADDPRAAAELYRQLTRRYPRSAEGQVARLTLAQLELDALGRPKVALEHFDRYLAGHHGLREEAEYGRIRALRRLGRRRAERRAIEAFLRAHPRSSSSTALRLRRDELNGPSPR